MKAQAVKRILRSLGVLVSFLSIWAGPILGQACVEPPADLVSWWPADIDAADLQEVNDGVFVDDASIGTGHVGGAFTLDGDGDYVDYGVSASATLNWPAGSSFTYDFWLRTTENEGVIISQRSTDAIGRPVIDIVLGFDGFASIGDGAIGAILRDDMGNTFCPSSGCTRVNAGTVLVNDGSFHHVAVVRDASATEVRLYVDGQLEASEVDNLSEGITTQYRTIGHERHWAEHSSGTISADRQFFDGEIDEFEIHSHALSGSEIQGIFNAGTFGKCKASTCDFTLTRTGQLQTRSQEFVFQDLIPAPMGCAAELQVRGQGDFNHPSETVDWNLEDLEQGVACGRGCAMSEDPEGFTFAQNYRISAASLASIASDGQLMITLQTSASADANFDPTDFVEFTLSYVPACTFEVSDSAVLQSASQTSIFSPSIPAPDGCAGELTVEAQGDFNADGEFVAWDADGFASGTACGVGCNFDDQPNGFQFSETFLISDSDLLAMAGDGSVTISLDASDGVDSNNFDPTDFMGFTLRYVEPPVESTIQDVGTGVTVTTDTEGDGAQPADPVETTLTTPNAGTVSIVEAFASSTPPMGFVLFGNEVQISAPTTDPSNPIVIVFEIDSSATPLGEDETTIEVLRDTVVVGPCVGGPGVANPDPCVQSRVSQPDGDVEITVLTSAASLWSLGVAAPGCAASPDPTCLDTFGKGLLLVKERVLGREKFVAKFSKGPALTQSDLGNPLSGETGTAYSVCIYNAAQTLVGELEVDRAADICAGKDCWNAIGKDPPDGKGYVYKDKDAVSDGALLLKIKGGDQDKSLALVKGKNNQSKGQTALPTGIALGLAGGASATVQIVSTDAGECLSMTLTEIKKAEPDFFKAK